MSVQIQEYSNQAPYFKHTQSKAQGFPSYKQKFRINPQGNIDQFRTNELIRFQFATENWFDPYQNYFEVTIEMDTVNFGPYDILALDGPSTSIISELIVQINGQEIERIYEYDQIGKFLSDFLITQDEVKKNKWNEGYIYDPAELGNTYFDNKLKSQMEPAGHGMTAYIGWDSVNTQYTYKNDAPYGFLNGLGGVQPGYTNFFLQSHMTNRTTGNVPEYVQGYHNSNTTKYFNLQDYDSGNGDVGWNVPGNWPAGGGKYHWMQNTCLKNIRNTRFGHPLTDTMASYNNDVFSQLARTDLVEDGETDTFRLFTDPNADIQMRQWEHLYAQSSWNQLNDQLVPYPDVYGQILLECGQNNISLRQIYNRKYGMKAHTGYGFVASGNYPDTTVQEYRPPRFGQILSINEPFLGIQHASSYATGTQSYIYFTTTGATLQPNPLTDFDSSMTCSAIGYQRAMSPYIKQDKYFYFMQGSIDFNLYGYPRTIDTNSVPSCVRYNKPQYINEIAGVWEFDQTQKNLVNRSVAQNCDKYYRNRQSMSTYRQNTVKTFQIPLLSGLIGHLLPAEQHRLMPGSWFKQIYFEVRCNPYAFFTSGYKYGGVLKGAWNDATNSYKYDTNTQTLSTYQTELPRNWTFKQFDFVMELFQFPGDVQQQVLQSYGDAMVLSSQFYYLAHSQEFSNTAQASTTINLYEKNRNVRSIWWWYYLNDYKNIPCCRKHYRINANVTEYQAQLGIQYWPFHPAKGHAGHYFKNSVITEDNQIYVNNLYDALGYTFGGIHNDCPVNPVNFAVNDRCWDPTFLSSKTPDQFTPNEALQITDGISVFNEWRQGMGGGIYCINFEAIPQSGYCGLDLSQTSEPLQLKIKTDMQNYNKRSVQMFVWMHLDVQYTIGRDGTIDIQR